jgi:hypothetical protein
MTKLNIIIISSFLFSACSSGLLFSPEKDLVDTFKLDSDKLEKFKTTEVKRKVTKSAAEKFKPPIVTKPVKRKKKVESNKISNKVSETTPKISNRPKLPKGYPERFFDYDQKYMHSWSKFRPVVNHGEEFKLNVQFLGITAGYITMKVMPNVEIGGREAYHFYAKLTSAKFYQFIYSLDDFIDSYVDVETFLPVKYTLVQRESAQKVDDLQIFDSEKRKTYVWYKRVKKDRNRDLEFSEFIPYYIQDSFSALHFGRGLLKGVGKVGEFPVVTRGKLWILKMEVLKIEEVKVNDTVYQAYKVKAETRFPGVLKKKGDIIFWFSADERRLFLKFEAKVKIGSISGEMIEYKPGTPR